MDSWQSQGFYGKKFPVFLEEDFLLREFLTEKMKEAGIDSIKIERSANRIGVIVNSARPGLIIGRGGSGAEELKKELKKKLIALRKKRGREKAFDLRLEIQEVKNPWTSASLVSQAVAKQLEKRIPFRRTMKQALDKVMENKEIKGAKIEVAGRLDGADISRTEWLKRGQLPRQTLRADIDYGQARALCTYGILGIKVWLYRGEKFDF
jgi:small subunit ribosomal protein S3